MIKPKLNQYSGRLTPDQVAAGMNAARENAQRLAADSRTLFDLGRYPSAASLAILSIEEEGKTNILRGLCLAESEEELHKRWREYRSHTKKNAMTLFPEMYVKGARRLADFSPLFSEDAEHPFLIEMVKQLGLYTDCLGEAHWSIPANAIDEELAKTLVTTAELLTKHGKEITTREIELWIEHLKPVWQSDLSLSKQAISNWWAAMQAEGYAPKGENEMKQFIYSSIIDEINKDTQEEKSEQNGFE